MGKTDESPYDNKDDGWDFEYRGARHARYGQESYEMVDANTLKNMYAEQHASVLKADGNTSQMLMYKKGTKKTKALTTDAAKLRDFNKVIIYCPTCQGYGGTRRMMPYKLEVLLDNPEAYTELVGGLPFEDDTIFLHCNYCDLRLLPSIDEVEKLDARAEDEYEITSLADVTKRTQKPVIAGQSHRYNKLRDKQQEILQRRRRLAEEQLKEDYERKAKGDKPKE